MNFFSKPKLFSTLKFKFKFDDYVMHLFEGTKIFKFSFIVITDQVNTN